MLQPWVRTLPFLLGFALSDPGLAQQIPLCSGTGCLVSPRMHRPDFCYLLPIAEYFCLQICVIYLKKLNFLYIDCWTFASIAIGEMSWNCLKYLEIAAALGVNVKHCQIASSKVAAVYVPLCHPILALCILRLYWLSSGPWDISPSFTCTF